MDIINFGYSMKIILSHSKSSYLYKLIDQVEKVLKRMRWKVLFFDRDQANSIVAFVFIAFIIYSFYNYSNYSFFQKKKKKNCKYDLAKLNSFCE